MSKGVVSKDEDYSQWYNDLVIKADMAEYSPIKGCMIIKPYGYSIWEKMQAVLDKMFKDTGHVNAYFPLFIPKSFFRLSLRIFNFRRMISFEILDVTSFTGTCSVTKATLNSFANKTITTSVAPKKFFRNGVCPV